MTNIAKYVIGAVIALSAPTAATASSSTKSDSSCYDAYGYYGYSSAYCEHNMYGRSSPADRYSGQNGDLAWRAGQQVGRAPERREYSYLYRGFAMPDRGDRHSPDQGRDRDRG